MKRLNSKRFVRALFVVLGLIVFLLSGLFISLNFIVDPFVYWLASTKGARIFIAWLGSWFGVSILFDLFYKSYKRMKKVERFNALNVPYPRKFRGRKG